MQTVSQVDKIDISKALKMRFDNRLTYQEIGDNFGVSKQAVQQKLTRFTRLMKGPGEVEAYDKAKVQLLNAAELEMLHSCLDPVAIQKASLNNRAYAFNTIFNANRLTQGLATSNHSIKGIIGHHQKTLEDIDSAIASLEDD